MFGLDPTRLGVLRLIVLLECFGWGTATERAVRTAIQGKYLRGTLPSMVKATDFTRVQKSQPETRDCIYINPIVLLLVVTVIGGKKHGAEKHGSGKK